ncbi:chemokine-like factor [Lampris incognitus]|uniref:chemokine-like factor n=1 Tax=Lampris incognitus TaxID=2546036 RepID=UPI0024B57FF6|nr:chemokine-like factor [Lampris incognitus]
MAEDNDTPCVEVDAAFLKSIRGLLKVAEMVTLLVSFFCFISASRPKYTATAGLEFLITGFLLCLYLFKLNKKLPCCFWPLIDVFNSVFAAAFGLVMSLIAVFTYTHKSSLGGGVVGIITAVLFCVDGCTLFKRITFNRPRNETRTQH